MSTYTRNIRKRLLQLLIFGLVSLATVIFLTAQVFDLSSNTTQFRLKNGLEVIIYEDPSLPLVSVVVAYAVGSINDPENKAGLAFLMQHLMFQGSQNVGPLQHINYIQNVGGELNAATTFDKTYFYETVPSNQLGLVLWLESDRMNSLEISEATVGKIKEILINNDRQRRLQEPYSRYFFLIDQILYPDFSYGHALPGSEDTLRNITVEDVISFYRRYYVPNNAVLCISGDVKAQKVRELVARYFETIPRGPESGSYPASDFRSVYSSRDQIMIDPLVSTPALQFGIRFDDFQSGEVQLFKLLEYLLLNGKTSRLYKRLVNKERLALYLNGGLEDRREFLSLKIFLLANNQIMIDRSKKIILEEFNRLKTEMVSEKELSRAKNKYKFDYLSRMTGTNLSRCLALAESYLSEGKLPDVPSELSNLTKVTSYSILSLARRHLREEKYCFITILPR
ncbi:MAG: insulinase family protein [Candidatus Aminicenantes bacterium]|nr:insulinase family protein [Candidatus Aminicenantes bacterium]